MKIKTVTYHLCPECGGELNTEKQAVLCCDEKRKQSREARKISNKIKAGLESVKIRIVRRKAYDGDRYRVARAKCPNCSRNIEVVVPGSNATAYSGEHSKRQAKNLVRAQLARHLASKWSCY